MTTATIVRQSRTPNVGRIIIIALVLAAAYIAVIQLNNHAIRRHGADAQAVRQCANDSNLLQVWQKNGSDRYHCLFKMPDGRIGDMLVQLDEQGYWHEISSFPRYEQTLGEVEKSLGREATMIYPPGG